MNAHNLRIQRCATANEDKATRMRHCEHCEVPVGVLTFKRWMRKRVCPVCGKPVHAVAEEEKAEQVIGFTAAYMRYDVSKADLHRAMENGQIAFAEKGLSYLMRTCDLERMYGRRV